MGGRCSQEATFFIELLAQHKARQAPPILQHFITTALIARWSALLTHAAQQAFAATPKAMNQLSANFLRKHPPKPPQPAGSHHSKHPRPQKFFFLVPSLKHIWRLASIKQSAVSRESWTSCGKRCGGKKNGRSRH